MLERLRLRNYQTHTDYKLRVGPGCTTIIGQSDRGKSSILRALRWLCTGKPNGSTFIRRGAKETSITLWIDGHKIQRQRGAADAGVYTVNGQTYRNPAGVP